MFAEYGPMLFLAHQSRKDLARVGLVHICTFILLKLSGERQFSVALNKPFDSYRRIYPAEGTHADLQWWYSIGWS